jgi:hypothetical protein
MKLFARPNRRHQDTEATDEPLDLEGRLEHYRVDREIDATVEMPADAPVGVYAAQRRTRALRDDSPSAPPRTRW